VTNHAGKIKRICVQANTHGIARKFLIFCEFLRLFGLEPINNLPKIYKKKLIFGIKIEKEKKLILKNMQIF